MLTSNSYVKTGILYATHKVKVRESARTTKIKTVYASAKSSAKMVHSIIG